VRFDNRYWLARLLSFKQPLLSVDVSVRLSVRSTDAKSWKLSYLLAYLLGLPYLCLDRVSIGKCLWRVDWWHLQSCRIRKLGPDQLFMCTHWHWVLFHTCGCVAEYAS